MHTILVVYDFAARASVPMKTRSELLFEEYCETAGFGCARVTEGSRKTPDYDVTVDRQLIVTEVAEIERTPEERESDRVLGLRGYGNVTGGTPGERVRSKINGCSKQLRERMRGVYPSMLVLFDRGFAHKHLDPYHVRVAMYGLDVLHLALPSHHSERPRIVGRSSGPKRKMTPTMNTSISAIGVLYMIEETPALVVYHNDFAKVPLNAAVLAKHGVRQRTRGSERKWTEVQ